MADASKIRRDLPYLANYGKDIDSWIEDFKNIMEIYNIEEPNRIFIWVKNAVEADIKNLLKSLCTTRNNVKRFPSYKEIQRAIEDYLEITQNDKCSVLKALKIKRNEMATIILLMVVIITLIKIINLLEIILLIEIIIILMRIIFPLEIIILIEILME